MLRLPPRQTAAEACTELLRKEIVAGRWAPDERLPPERELSEQLGVTRVTLRSALAALSAEGLVEARQGSGTRVRDYRLGSGPGLLPALLEHALAEHALTEVVADLLALRRGLAREVLTRLARRPPTAEAVAQVDAAVAGFAETVAQVATPPSPEELEQLAQADLAVLRAVVDATGSTVFQLGLNPIGQALGSLPALRAAVYRSPEGNLLGWQGLAAWLRDPDPAGAEGMVALLAARDQDTLDHLPGEEA